jgi:ankyrin repeat protein
MPPTGPLSNEEIGIFRAWIDQGAEFRIEVKGETTAKPVDPKLAGLITAVRNRDLKTVRKTIAAHRDLVNAHDATGATPLHHAAGFGDPATMKLLIEHHADVNGANKRKSTPLFWAMYDAAKVQLLLDHGADVNARTIDGRTPIYQAASMANAAPVLKLLLAKGANPNAKTLNGMTPLIAASRYNLEAERMLIEAGADINATNAAGGTALMLAAASARPEAVRMLLEKGANVNLRTKRNETALADAATAGNEEIVKMLLDRGAEVNVPDIRGYSPLLYAAGSEATPAGIVKMLLAKGADRDARGDDETAAMLAAKRGDTEVARLLGVSEQERKKLGVVVRPASVRGDQSIAAAVGPALALLEKQSNNFIRIGGCNSCHAQDLPSAAAAIARERGLPAPKEIPQLPQSMHTLNPSRIMDLVVVGPVGLGWEMFDFANNRVPRDEYTDATVRYLKAMQAADGSWQSLPSRRPPMAAGAFQTTAMSIYSLVHYGPPAEQAETQQVIARAATWLEAGHPVTTQDRAFHLLGLAWANAKPAVIASAAKALAESQREDGGWNQMPSMGSDAYATGQALYALHIGGGMAAANPVYARGVKYLLSTQAADGSWHVKSRSIWLQPYFESGFPYGHDQWISAAGTAWATMALSMSVDPRNPSGHPTQVASTRAE